MFTQTNVFLDQIYENKGFCAVFCLVFTQTSVFLDQIYENKGFCANYTLRHFEQHIYCVHVNITELEQNVKDYTIENL